MKNNIINLTTLVLLLLLLLLNFDVISGKVVELNECLSKYTPESIRSQIRLIEPDQALNEQIIQAESLNAYKGSKKLYYLINNLRASTQYAVRISYPASSPAAFSIEFLDNPLTNEFIKYDNTAQDINLKMRDTLNTEIIKFRTDSNAMVIESEKLTEIRVNPCSIIEIESINTGITPTFVKERDLNRYQSFNLILETEALLVPPEIPRVIFIALFSTILFFLIVVRKLFPKVKGFQLLK